MHTPNPVTGDPVFSFHTGPSFPNWVTNPAGPALEYTLNVHPMLIWYRDKLCAPPPPPCIS